MLEAIALEAGYRVGLHTSPHLVRFEERCRVDGRAVDAAALLPHFEAVERVRGEIALTFFEFTLLAIARLLAAERLDLVVLEVGLGGRFDAVNAFDADCAVITSIAIDHTEYLGATREAIGFEKAGIMRAGRPVVVSDPLPPQSVIEHAAAVGAELWLLGPGLQVLGRPPAVELGRPRAALQRHGLSRRCAVPTSCSTRRACWPPSRHCASACRSARRRCEAGSRASNCQGASRSFPASRRWCSTSRTTRTRWPRWRTTSTRWASIRARTRCSARWRDKDIAAMLCRMAPARRQLAFHRPAHATRGERAGACTNCMPDSCEPDRPAGLSTVHAACHASPVLALRCRPGGGRPR